MTRSPIKSPPPLLSVEDYGIFTGPFDPTKLSSGFRFTCEGSDLETCLQRALSVLSTDTSSTIKYTMIVVHDGCVSVLAISPEILVEVLVDADNVTGSGHIAVDSQVLAGLIKNRGDMFFSYKGDVSDGDVKNELMYKASKGAYKGSVIVVDIDDRIYVMLNDKIANLSIKGAIRKEVFSEIMSGIKLTDLRNIYNTSRVVLKYIVYDADTGNLSVYSYDSWHLLKYDTTITPVKGDQSFKLSFVPNRLDVLSRNATTSKPSSRKKKPDDEALDDAKTIADNCLGFAVTDSGMSFVTNNFRALVPYSQAVAKDFEIPMNVVSGLASPAAEFLFNDAMIGSSNNLESLMTVKGLQFSIKVTGKQVVLSIKTNSGDASEVLPAKVIQVSESGAMINFDPTIFSDLTKALVKAGFSQGKGAKPSPAKFSIYDSCYLIKYKPAGTAFLLTLMGSVYNA